MASDFEQIGHKNIELLRFYVSKDIKRIDKKIQTNESNLLGYFLGSIVDVLIMFIFNDFVKDFVSNYGTINVITILISALIIILFLSVFLFVVWVSKTVQGYIKRRNRISGKSIYTLEDEQREVIDDFDNIACDGLLICQNYIQKYEETNIGYLKDFYLFEIIHHLSKSSNIFSRIYENKCRFISQRYDELIDVYRANNFIDFSNEIILFLNGKIEKEYSGIQDLATDMDNLNAKISSWDKIILKEIDGDIS